MSKYLFAVVKDNVETHPFEETEHPSREFALNLVGGIAQTVGRLDAVRVYENGVLIHEQKFGS